MSMVETPARESHAAIRRRLLNPPNGRESSELDIVAAPVARRRREAEEALTRETEAAAARTRQTAAAVLRARLAATQEFDQSEARERRIADLVQQIQNAQGELKTLCAESLAEFPRDFSARGKFSQIFEVVCKFYSVHAIHILSIQRTANIVRPRHVVMFLARELTGMSFAQIGRRLGDRDHTTVLSGIRRIERCLASGDEDLAAEIAAIRRSLGVG